MAKEIARTARSALACARIHAPCVIAGVLLAMLVCTAPGHADEQAEAVSEAMQPVSPPEEAEQKPVPSDEEASQQQPAPETAPQEKPVEEEKPEAPPKDTGEPPWSPLPEAAPESEIITFEADEFYYEDGEMEAWGNLRGAYQEYTFAGDYLHIGEDREWLTLKDNVSIRDPDWLTTGSRLRLNLDTEQWELFEGKTAVQPSFFERGVLEPLYLYADEIDGRPDEITVRHGIGTSCDRAEGHQHYWLQSSDIGIRPGDVVVFHKPTLYLLGERIFQYPFDLRLSLKERQNRFVPEFGQNEVDGYFARLAYLYYISEAHSGVARYQMTEKRGMGFGVQHYFDFVNNYGDLNIFAEPAEGSVTGRLSDRHEFDTDTSLDLRSNLQRYSGYGFGSTSLDNTLTFRTRSADADSTVAISQSLMESSFNTTRRYGVDVSHSQQASENYRWDVDANLSRNDYRADEEPDEELDTDFRIRGRQTAYDWEAGFRKRYDIDGDAYTGDDNFYSLDHEPEIVFNTDSSRMGHFDVFGDTLQSSLRLGAFHQQPDEVDVSRARLDLSLPGRTREIGSDTSLRTSARFRQGFYDDGSAQWSSDMRTTVEGPIGSPWEYRLSLSHSTVHGFAPLRLDYASNRVSADLQLASVVADDRRIDISSGYDFVNDYYRDARFRGLFMLGAANRLEAQTSYAIERGEWNPLNLRWLRGTDDWYSALTTYYDLDEHELTRASGEINWRINDQWYLGLQTGYDGRNDEFDQVDVQIVRELHCMRASLTYNKELNELRFNIGITAFPSDARPLSTGAGGSRFESTFSPYR